MNTAAQSDSIPLDDRMRLLLKAGGPINATGALIFAPPFPYVRQLFGLPDGHALYLWVLSIWILAFGWAYWSMGVAGRADRTLLTVGTVGKASFGLTLIALAMTGQVPWIAAGVGLPDLGIALFYANCLMGARALPAR